jgi:hypothetical protein
VTAGADGTLVVWQLTPSDPPLLAGSAPVADVVVAEVGPLCRAVCFAC